mmetsp:Transcript_10568/g.30201  ORF Transcript_10568/g.30201 Transcript_10568/m.30201 type:complete len:314 (+) Transcript_10568:239-1180(+)
MRRRWAAQEADVNGPKRDDLRDLVLCDIQELRDAPETECVCGPGLQLQRRHLLSIAPAVLRAPVPEATEAWVEEGRGLLALGRHDQLIAGEQRHHKTRLLMRPGADLGVVAESMVQPIANHLPQRRDRDGRHLLLEEPHRNICVELDSDEEWLRHRRLELQLNAEFPEALTALEVFAEGVLPGAVQGRVVRRPVQQRESAGAMLIFEGIRLRRVRHQQPGRRHEGAVHARRVACAAAALVLCYLLLARVLHTDGGLPRLPPRRQAVRRESHGDEGHADREQADRQPPRRGLFVREELIQIQGHRTQPRFRGAT